MTVFPKKELGQHFLIDKNILRVIERLAELRPDDTVLEVGAGLGVLTDYLAERVARVHAVELDRSLEPHLRARLAEHANIELRFDDALALRASDLAPPPGKLVANLPYSIATPLIVESLDRFPSIGLWCVMVQREVADRLFAPPATKAYGAVSVLVQLVTERTGFHPVSRSVFRPQPNVDSALVAFRRLVDAPSLATVKPIVTAAFAHRRKTLANALELAGIAGRSQAAGAAAAIGRPADVRADALAPSDFVRLAELLS